MVSLVQACREERRIFICLFVNRTYICFYNKWHNQGLYKRNYWTLPCVTTQSSHHNWCRDQDDSLGGLSVRYRIWLEDSGGGESGGSAVSAE